MNHQFGARLRVLRQLVYLAVVGNLAAVVPVVAQESATNEHSLANDSEKLHAVFAKQLSGVALVGTFTIDGETDKLEEERYEIRKVTKQSNDYWLFLARIKYGQHDLTLPLPLPVKWAGKTPVITLDNVKIPGLGTFSARVIIDKDRYAGTWQHGQVGGHMFGRIEELASPN